MMMNLTVCGSGAMGSQIAMAAALAGHTVRLYDLDGAALERAHNELMARMNDRVAKGRIAQDHVDAAFTRLSLTDDLATAAKGCDFMIEAIVEQPGAKRQLFARFEEYAPEHAVLATNSSSIVSSKLANGLRDPSRVCNMHFFNPALVMELVEVVEGEHTSPDTVEQAMKLAASMGKHPIHIRHEVFGFVVNRILMRIFDEAIALEEAGIASIEDIDAACRKGLGHPIGPFALLDLTGLDVNHHIKSLYAQETGDPEDGPSQRLDDLVSAGKLGRKSGEGFYSYGES